MHRFVDLPAYLLLDAILGFYLRHLLHRRDIAWVGSQRRIEPRIENFLRDGFRCGAQAQA